MQCWHPTERMVLLSFVVDRVRLHLGSSIHTLHKMWIECMSWRSEGAQSSRYVKGQRTGAHMVNSSRPSRSSPAAISCAAGTPAGHAADRRPSLRRWRVFALRGGARRSPIAIDQRLRSRSGAGGCARSAAGLPRVRQADGLDTASLPAASFDLVIGNPPYGVGGAPMAARRPPARCAFCCGRWSWRGRAGTWRWCCRAACWRTSGSRRSAPS